MNSVEPHTPRHLEMQYMDDEIDLLELFAVLWRGKWIVVSITLLCAVAAFVWLKLQPSIYRVDASIDTASTYEIRALQPSTLSGGEDYQVPALDREEIYGRLLNQAGTLYLKKQYWEAETGIRLPASLNGESNENVAAFKLFSNSLSVKLPDKSASNTVAQLSLNVENPSEGVTQLHNYLDFVDQFMINRIIEQLLEAYRTNIDRLIYDYQSLKNRERQRIEDELVKLKEAHDVAQSLDIVETPYNEVEGVELQVLDNRLYLLGTRALAEEIKALEGRKEKPIEIFVPKLRQMEQWQQQMENDLQRLESIDGTDFNTFTVVSAPESSLDPVEPNKSLIFVALVFGAGIFGVATVFIVHGVRSYHARTNQEAISSSPEGS